MHARVSQRSGHMHIAALSRPIPGRHGGALPFLGVNGIGMCFRAGFCLNLFAQTGWKTISGAAAYNMEVMQKPAEDRVISRTCR